MNTVIETEVKIRIPDPAAIVERLQAAGFAVTVPRQFEANTLYDTEDKKLKSSGMILRLRQVGDRCVLTWKGPRAASAHKSRPELETGFDSFEVMDQILRQLGYRPSFRYEKFRTEFADSNGHRGTPVQGAARSEAGAGIITVDETPVGNFLELEGAGEWIDATAKRLGFKPQEYILESYGTLYLADCERRGMQPGHMVFASHP